MKSPAHEVKVAGIESALMGGANCLSCLMRFHSHWDIAPSFSGAGESRPAGISSVEYPAESGGCRGVARERNARHRQPT